MGSLTYRPLGVDGNRINVTRSTISHFGNAGVVTHIPNTPPAAPGKPDPVPQPMEGRHLEVSYCHIHHGGLVGMDTAALYTGGWNAAGLHWHHNWVHDASEKCIRGDDQSANMTLHHNVVYNCGLAVTDAGSGNAGLGIILKGDGHLVYANTVFQSNYSELCLPACVSPPKPWSHQYPLTVQNAHSTIFNVAARRDLGFPSSCKNKTHDLHNPGGLVLGGFFSGADLGLQNVSAMDFRPSASSPLVDAGAIIKPYTNGYIGAKPDIGAYERGGTWWKAGCAEVGKDALEFLQTGDMGLMV